MTKNNERKIYLPELSDGFSFSKKLKFAHGKIYQLPNNINLISSYHPSPRNVNTKVISEKMMIKLFKKAKKISAIKS